jgi:hypothetical protein
VSLRDPLRHSTRSACFLFGARRALLPAFGVFTGTKVVRPMEDDRVFVMNGDDIVEVRTSARSRQ